jgi:hypothetical protein
MRYADAYAKRTATNCNANSYSAGASYAASKTSPYSTAAPINIYEKETHSSIRLG